MTLALNQLPQNNRSFYGLVNSTMAKALFLGVVSLGCFAREWCSSSVAMLTVMVNLS